MAAPWKNVPDVDSTLAAQVQGTSAAHRQHVSTHSTQYASANPRCSRRYLLGPDSKQSSIKPQIRAAHSPTTNPPMGPILLASFPLQFLQPTIVCCTTGCHGTGETTRQLKGEKKRNPEPPRASPLQLYSKALHAEAPKEERG